MQSKKMSTIEAVVNLLVGQIYAVITYMLILPLFGYKPTISKSIGLTMCFCVFGFIRTYLLRRLFNWIDTKRKL